VTDSDCTVFLQWALPQAGLRWPGFRKVRRQVCKRLRARARELGLDDFDAYRARLEADPSEWLTFDECCHITISRFFRDRGIFDALRRQVLPSIAARAKREGRGALAWSAGCASGEEPYTLRILWDIEIAIAYPGVPLAIVASDVDKGMLARARRGCFESSSLHELPALLIKRAFDRVDSLHCVKQVHRQGIEFLDQDLRTEMPQKLFDLILCRYVAFTYFAAPVQRTVLAGMLERLRPAGFLVIGTHEELPDAVPGLTTFGSARQIFVKGSASGAGISTHTVSRNDAI
jgi:chemotaxis protein methyltransferase CheR